MAGEIARGIDPDRGFKMREDDSWIAQAQRFASRSAQEVMGSRSRTARRVRMYTFGAPRVGNVEFAKDFDSIGIEAFRVVNGADIVPRMPRHGNSAGAVLDYEHVGRTVLITEMGDDPDDDATDRTKDEAKGAAQQEAKGGARGESGGARDGASLGFWVEGESDDADCPLREYSPLTNPFGKRSVLG